MGAHRPCGVERFSGHIAVMSAPMNGIGRRVWPEAAELAQSIGSSSIRLATGVPSLDAATRGGLPTSRLVAIGGAPGAGKTTLAIWLAFVAAHAGWSVAVLCDDEARETCMIRWGQLEGIARTDLEMGEPRARDALSKALRRVDVLFVDGDDDRATIEDVDAELRHRAGSTPSALVADSVQTARVDAARSGSDRRSIIDAVVSAMKRTAKRGSLVLGTSEVSRGWYRSKRDRVNPLSAFKESGGIEYGLALGLVLDEMPGRAGDVDVIVAKNRIGIEKPTFRLRQDFERASFVEVPRSVTREVDVSTGKDAEIAAAVERVLVIGGATKSATALASLVTVGRKGDRLRVIRQLVELGRIDSSAGRLRLALDR